MAKGKLKTNIKVESPLHSTESFKSLIYGVLTVTLILTLVLTGVFIFSKRGKGGDYSLGETKGVKASVKPAKVDESKSTTYKVVGGEGLWDISVKVYGDGFRWVDIAKANNLSSPESITEGMVLRIPDLKK